MRVSEEYPVTPGKWLTAEDLQALGGELHVQIDYVEEGVVMGMPKVARNVLHFIEDIKPLVLRPITARALAQALGDSSDGWGGAYAVLYLEDTEMGPGIRIRVERKPVERGNQHDESNPPPYTAAELDEIPF